MKLLIILMILLAGCRGDVYNLDKEVSEERKILDDESYDTPQAKEEPSEVVESENEDIEGLKVKEGEEGSERGGSKEETSELVNEENEKDRPPSQLDDEKANEKANIEVNIEEGEGEVINISNMPNPGEPLYYEREIERELGDYSTYSNEERDWWFKRPKPTHQGVLADIDPGIRKILVNYNIIWQGDTNLKKVYLTFDEGYEYKNNTSQVLDTLKAKGVKAAFFITGGFLRDNPDIVKRMYNEGHLVCNHTDRHLNGPKALNESEEKFIKDITDLEDDYRALMGHDIHPYFRPPSGIYSERTLKIVEDMGYTSVLWSFAYHDWDTKAQPDPAKALNQIVGELHNGSVLLLHSVSDTNVAILPDLIDAIREKGYEIGSIDNI